MHVFCGNRDAQIPISHMVSENKLDDNCCEHRIYLCISSQQLDKQGCRNLPMGLSGPAEPTAVRKSTSKSPTNHKFILELKCSFTRSLLEVSLSSARFRLEVNFSCAIFRADVNCSCTIFRSAILATSGSALSHTLSMASACRSSKLESVKSLRRFKTTCVELVAARV